MGGRLDLSLTSCAQEETGYTRQDNSTHADLPAISILQANDVIDGGIKLTVSKHYDRGVSAKLEREALDRCRARCDHSFAHDRRSDGGEETRDCAST